MTSLQSTQSGASQFAPRDEPCLGLLRGFFLECSKVSQPTAREILTAMNEYFRHHNSVDPYAMFDATSTFKQVVEKYLQSDTKKARQTNLTGQ